MFDLRCFNASIFVYVSICTTVFLYRKSTIYVIVCWMFWGHFFPVFSLLLLSSSSNTQIKHTVEENTTKVIKLLWDANQAKWFNSKTTEQKNGRENYIDKKKLTAKRKKKKCSQCKQKWRTRRKTNPDKDRYETTKTKRLTTLQILLWYGRHHNLHSFPYFPFIFAM